MDKPRGLSSLLIVALACGGEDAPAVDAGLAADAGAAQDAAAPMDAGGADADADLGAPMDAEAPDFGAQSMGTVAECEAAVDEARAACRGEAARECFWGAWRAQCSRGQDDVIREAASCFAGDSICRSMGDPGTRAGIACTNAALARGRSSAVQASIDAYCRACPREDDLCGDGNGSFGAPFEFLPDADQPALQTCLASAGGCDAAVDCAVAAFDGLAQCL